MPRHADVTQQRDLIAAAVLQLVNDSGLEAVSLRTVAAQAGVSMGRVQHYFRTKDELLLHGLSYAYQRMEARIIRRAARSSGSERDVLIAILEEMLGVHPDTRLTIRVTSSYAVRARTDQRIAAVLTEGDTEILALATTVLADAWQGDETVDPEAEARALWAMVCGLGSEVALYDASPARARRTLHYRLRQLLPQ